MYVIYTFNDCTKHSFNRTYSNNINGSSLKRFNIVREHAVCIYNKHPHSYTKKFLSYFKCYLSCHLKCNNRYIQWGTCLELNKYPSLYFFSYALFLLNVSEKYALLNCVCVNRNNRFPCYCKQFVHIRFLNI